MKKFIQYVFWQRSNTVVSNVKKTFATNVATGAPLSPHLL
jgi:hypothetical protein